MTAITYTLDFCKQNTHLVDCHLNFVANDDNPILWLPTWLAGSYLIREFSKNIVNVLYLSHSPSDKPCQHSDNSDNWQRAPKINKNHWQLTAKKGDVICVQYSVYCHDLSVRTAYVDHQRIFGNFSSLLLHITGSEFDPCVIDFVLAYDFFNNSTLATALPFIKTNKGYRFDKLPNVKSLQSSVFGSFVAMDFPFEISPQSMADFVMYDSSDAPIAHRFFVSGRFDTNLTDICQDVAQICQSYIDWLDFVPFADYTFMTHATGGDYGGLEHINSTALIVPRHFLDKNNRNDYLALLGLCSHEYFHAWWVKTVRPDVMMISRFNEEAYTPLLWIFEGFTSYIDDQMLYRSGVINKTDYLELLNNQIERYLNNTGRQLQSVTESSFDAWIKLYRPDENSRNATTSYYNKGAIVALGMDLLLIKHGKRLFDVIKHLVGHAKNQPKALFGLSDGYFDEIMTQILGDAWGDFKACYVNGVDELPLQQWLAEVGVTLKCSHDDSTPFGITMDNAMTIKHLNPFGQAYHSGLSANDVLVAVDGIKASLSALQYAHNAQKQHKKPLTLHIFRRDELHIFKLPFDGNNNNSDDNAASGDKLVSQLTLSDDKAVQIWLDKN